ncbi:uncharacterized protein LOC109200617 [Oreochromis niloticus]|uniref:uncharacterized protein LOC109200617 n=1 Tax=Oreochromis niloticus TaxID=8128 RepID=UPI000DF44EE1|nr:uncharacterized protein LOC109200617 [Oreochromis niloticus]
MNHYTSGVILYGERELIRRQSLSKVNFDNYRAILSFVNIGNVHWKFLYINADDSCLYLVDPSRNSLEQEESDRAAKRFREYFKMRRTCYNKTDWVNVRLQGGVLTHPFQRDGSSCGVMVIMMAKAVMEAFPNKPEMTFWTTKKRWPRHEGHLHRQYLRPQYLTVTPTVPCVQQRNHPIQDPPSLTGSSVITATAGSILNAWT